MGEYWQYNRVEDEIQGPEGRVLTDPDDAASTLDDMQTTITALEAKVEELEGDKARLDWANETNILLESDGGSLWILRWWDNAGAYWKRTREMPTLRAAIDAGRETE